LEDRIKPAATPEPPRQAAPEPRPPAPPARPAQPSQPPQMQPSPSRPLPRAPVAPLDQTIPVAPPPARRSMAETALYPKPDQRPTQPEPRREAYVPPARTAPPPPPPPPPARAPAPPQPPPVSRPPQPPPAHYPRPPAPAPAPIQHAKPKARPERIVIGVAIGFVVLLLLAAGGYWYFFSGAGPLPAVGTAEVVGAKAAIYEGPSRSNVIQRLAPGDKVNVLRLPRT